MTLAFYAPLKPPTHPVPSGDRAMARALIAALEYAGYGATLASDLRIYDGRGDATIQDDLYARAQDEIARILDQTQAQNWQAWITYHNYYKAPDLIGPAVARTLNIPYCQIESTRARKRLSGPWARFAQDAEAACDAASAVFYLTEHDAQTLRRDAPDGQHLYHLRPFLARATLPDASTRTGAMLSVAMMRRGDKLASYALISQTLAALPRDLDWQLEIAGDGPARDEVAALMAPFGDRVTFLGALDPQGLAARYATASLLLWPGVNEAFGMIYLEAQAAGIPVVAQDRPGVRDVVHGPLIDVANGAHALAARICALAGDADTRRTQGTYARAQIGAHHLLGQAATTLKAGIEEAMT